MKIQFSQVRRYMEKHVAETVDPKTGEASCTKLTEMAEDHFHLDNDKLEDVLGEMAYDVVTDYEDENLYDPEADAVGQDSYGFENAPQVPDYMFD